MPGGRELVALGRAAAEVAVDRQALDAVAAVTGLPAALDAAAVAANFEIMNRAVDATGLSLGPRQREGARDLIELLGLETFPHAAH